MCESCFTLFIYMYSIFPLIFFNKYLNLKLSIYFQPSCIAFCLVSLIPVLLFMVSVFSGAPTSRLDFNVLSEMSTSISQNAVQMTAGMCVFFFCKISLKCAAIRRVRFLTVRAKVSCCIKRVMCKKHTAKSTTEW